MAQLHPYTNEQTLVELLVCTWRLLRNDIVYLGSVDPALLSPLLSHESIPVRYVTIQLLSLYCDSADAQTTKVIKDSLGTESIHIRLNRESLVDLRIFEVEEACRLDRLKELLKQAPQTHESISRASLPRNIVEIAGVLLPRLGKVPDRQSRMPSMSKTTRSNMSELARAISCADAVLVEGISGSGKTFLVEELAKSVGKYKDIVRIHLGPQTDTKLLLGTYVTSSVAGQFSWQEGILTTAVKQGRWLLIDDIDKASADALSILLPLLEQRTLLIPNRDEVVQASPGFKIIATRRTEPSLRSAVKLLGARLWTVVQVEALPASELKEIICDKFQLLLELADMILEVYEAVCKAMMEVVVTRHFRETSIRAIGIIDLLKWCRRINALLIANSVQHADAPLPQAVYDNIFCEAVDCFASSRSAPDTTRKLVQAIGSSLGVPPEKVDLYLQSHRPLLEDCAASLTVGRASISKTSAVKYGKRRPFAETGQSKRLLEQLIISVNLCEPLLLVGETGTGKTATVQKLADTVGKTLTVINMSQQTETGDLLGGYKPIDTRTLAIPLLERFESLFDRTMSSTRNARFLREMRRMFHKGQWARFTAILGEAVKKALAKLDNGTPSATEIELVSEQKKKRRHNPDLLSAWTDFAQDLETFDIMHSQLKKSFAFAFVEGILIRALRNGDWVLLDELNLAAADTLESIHGLLQDGGSIVLSEKGDIEPVRPHPDFRLFSCMNPATDVGKRDLPQGIRSRFTEIFVNSPDSDMQDLLEIIKKYIGPICLEDDRACLDVAHLYMRAKTMAAENRLVDGAKVRPHYSIRTLARTLSYVNDVAGIYGLRRSLYEGFCMAYLTLLDTSSSDLLHAVIKEYTILRVPHAKSLLNQIPKMPLEGQWLQFKHYWLPKGPLDPVTDTRYVMTPSVENNMLNLARAATTHKYPILLQGPTSSGKTSMIEYLAACTGHDFVRINNHEHTDLQEYLGSYSSDEHGNLAFQEGILVTALRQGHWLVLDELNLAPSDVLEALNRLLDDNRELLIPETQEVVKPHPSFVLFATQNPAGLYGGRKHLSRAFRNRFLELHFDDIPEEELEVILCQRCQIAPSYCKRIVEVYKVRTEKKLVLPP